MAVNGMCQTNPSEITIKAGSYTPEFQKFNKVEIYTPSFQNNYYQDFQIKQTIQSAINDANLRDPMKEWIEQENLSELKSASSWLIPLGTCDLPGLGLKVVQEFFPRNSPQSDFISKVGDTYSGIGLSKDILTRGYPSFDGALGFIADKVLFEDKFDNRASITINSAIPLNRSWDDGFSRGSSTGQLNVSQSYTPDPSPKIDSYPWGTQSQSITGSYQIIETSGINNLHEFQNQWNSSIFQPQPVQFYNPPPVQFYTPPPVQFYTPPPVKFYTPSPVYTPTYNGH